VFRVIPFLISFMISAIGFFMTLYQQNVHGFSAVRTGLALLPMVISMMVLSPIGGTMINRVGPTFVHRLGEITGTTPPQIVRAYLAAREVFGLVPLWQQIEALDSKAPDEVQAEMADILGANSLRYLPVESIARAIKKEPSQLCQACITGKYPTPFGQELYQIALNNVGKGECPNRTYEVQHSLTFAE